MNQIAMIKSESAPGSLKNTLNSSTATKHVTAEKQLREIY